jgi:flagellar protein FlbD
MIDVTRLDGRPFTINADLIELIETTPDTIIRLINGNTYLVRESRHEVVDKVITYRQKAFHAHTSLIAAEMAIEKQAESHVTR